MHSGASYDKWVWLTGKPYQHKDRPQYCFLLEVCSQFGYNKINVDKLSLKFRWTQSLIHLYSQNTQSGSIYTPVTNHFNCNTLNSQEQIAVRLQSCRVVEPSTWTRKSLHWLLTLMTSQGQSSCPACSCPCMGQQFHL